MRFLISILFLTITSLTVVAEDSIHSVLIDETLSAWERISFEGETDYETTLDKGDTAIIAHSSSSASGLLYKTEFDLKRYPYLNWSWKVDKTLPKLNEQVKSGDDYVARVYVIVKDGWFFWQTKALNFVWSSNQNPSAHWPNAFAPDNTRMIPLKNANASTGIWYTEKRNIREDLTQWLGKDIARIEAIAIMTDSDNSGHEASASYKRIYFSAK